VLFLKLNELINEQQEAKLSLG